MDETLEFLQETPVKLQGKLVVSQSWIGFGFVREDLKMRSCWESL